MENINSRNVILLVHQACWHVIFSSIFKNLFSDFTWKSDKLLLVKMINYQYN